MMICSHFFKYSMRILYSVLITTVSPKMTRQISIQVVKICFGFGLLKVKKMADRRCSPPPHNYPFLHTLIHTSVLHTFGANFTEGPYVWSIWNHSLIQCPNFIQHIPVQYIALLRDLWDYHHHYNQYQISLFSRSGVLMSHKWKKNTKRK